MAAVNSINGLAILWHEVKQSKFKQFMKTISNTLIVIKEHSHTVTSTTIRLLHVATWQVVVAITTQP